METPGRQDRRREAACHTSIQRQGGFRSPASRLLVLLSVPRVDGEGAWRMAALRLQHTILFIGDQVGVQAELSTSLRRHGYQVLTAATRREAEAIGRGHGLAHLDLVIMTLPSSPYTQAHKMEALVQRWGAQALHLPFIVISPAPMPTRLAPPVVWWLATPVTSDTLLIAVRDTLGSSGAYDAAHAREEAV
jgi:DNA-binding NtrC family response regulator